MIRLAVVVAVLVLLAGCGGGEQATPQKKTTPASTTSAPAGPPTLDELVDDPCAVLTKDDEATLGVVAGGKTPADGSCGWVAGPGIVSFKPYPDSDETPRIAAKAGAEPLTVEGRPGVRIALDTSCFVYVTVADGQSIQVGAAGDAVPDLCAAPVEFAAVIVRNLR